jgi:hypothetical protein
MARELVALGHEVKQVAVLLRPIDHDPVPAGHGTRPAPALLEFRAIAAADISKLLRPLEKPSLAALPFFVRC